MGKRDGYKDFATVVAAFAEAGELGEVHLVCVGGGPLTTRRAGGGPCWAARGGSISSP